MANNVNEVLSGKPLITGGILVAPLGTALPVNTTTALNVLFVALGYVTDDGVTETIDRATDKIKAWGGDTIAVPQTDFGVTYAFTLAQSLNTNVLKAIWGDSNVTTTAATSTVGTLQTITMNATTTPHKEYVIVVNDKGALVRIVIPNGQMTQSGDTTYQDSTVITYPVTIDCLPDSAGNSAYKYMNDGIFSA